VGNKPADLSVEHASRNELVINLKTVKAMHLDAIARVSNWHFPDMGGQQLHLPTRVLHGEHTHFGPAVARESWKAREGASEQLSGISDRGATPHNTQNHRFSLVCEHPFPPLRGTHINRAARIMGAEIALMSSKPCER
jgi:hypothetical protein